MFDAPVADDLPVLPFASAEAWEAWLREHGAESPGVWMRLARKGSGIPSVTRDEAVDAALCHGWIDGQSRGGDDTTYLQRFTPRRARSIWSKRNRQRVAELEAEGRMAEAGRREVERAKADGRWEAAYDPPSTAEVPDDLRAALDAEPAAAEAFAGLGAQSRYVVLHRLMTAKRADTRERRIAQFVAMLARGERP